MLRHVKSRKVPVGVMGMGYIKKKSQLQYVETSFYHNKQAREA